MLSQPTQVVAAEKPCTIQHAHSLRKQVMPASGHSLTLAHFSVSTVLGVDCEEFSAVCTVGKAGTWVGWFGSAVEGVGDCGVTFGVSPKRVGSVGLAGVAAMVENLLMAPSG